MSMFTSFRRRPALGEQAPELELSEAVRQMLPPRFEAVGEALASGIDPVPACCVVGRDAARDGACLGEALSGLRATYALVGRGRPSLEAAEALSTAWSEATLEYLHRLSCEDPLTGLASHAHVRTRLDEIYRGAGQRGTSVRADHALVVVEVPGDADGRGGDGLVTAMRLVRVTEAMRSVFAGGETIGRLGPHRAVAVVRRQPGLGRSATLLRGMLDAVEVDRARVWIEGLPDGAESALCLVDELARGS